ncbi:MAG: hypothetical protein ACM34K_00615 [Bacillota bacterium]
MKKKIRQTSRTKLEEINKQKRDEALIGIMYNSAFFICSLSLLILSFHDERNESGFYPTHYAIFIVACMVFLYTLFTRERFSLMFSSLRKLIINTKELTLNKLTLEEIRYNILLFTNLAAAAGLILIDYSFFEKEGEITATAEIIGVMAMIMVYRRINNK